MILAAAALTLSLQVQRSAVEMLDGVGIEVVVHNPSPHPVRAEFAKPAEYEIQIRHGKKVVWSSLPVAPATANFPAHQHLFMPGPTVLTVFVWNGLDQDGRVPAPGEYRIVAKLLDEKPPKEASTAVRFIDPVPISAVSKLNEGDVFTIAGTFDAANGSLTDATGTLRLMRRITVPSGTLIAVRGYLTTASNGKAFYVNRWAPLPKTSPAPLSSPSPPVRRRL